MSINPIAEGDLSFPDPYSLDGSMITIDTENPTHRQWLGHNTPLDKVGEMQATKAGKLWRETMPEFDMYYVSKMPRAFQTAKMHAGDTNLQDRDLITHRSGKKAPIRYFEVGCLIRRFKYVGLTCLC